MAVKEAIKRLKEQVAPRLPKRPEIREAIAMAIEALEIWEKEKEPAPQEAETSSNNNNSTSNDNTKSKECQEDIDVIKKLFDVNSFLSGKTNVWCTLTSPQSLKYGRLVCVIDLFKEEKQ